MLQAESETSIPSGKEEGMIGKSSKTNEAYSIGASKKGEASCGRIDESRMDYWDRLVKELEKSVCETGCVLYRYCRSTDGQPIDCRLSRLEECPFAKKLTRETLSG